jgi:hypothetical protein
MPKKIKDLKKIAANKKFVSVITFVGIIGIAVIFLSGFFDTASGKTEATGDDIEQKLASIVSSIEGVGKAKVMIGYENSGKVPVILGAVIVCQGGNNPRIAEKVMGIATAALGVQSNKIEVVGGIID